MRSEGDRREWVEVATITRENEDVTIEQISLDVLAEKLPWLDEQLMKFSLGMEELADFRRGPYIVPSELLVNLLGRFNVLFRDFVTVLGGVRVFQISPNVTREFGVPGPRPELDRRGGNLPAVIDLMQKQYPGDWDQVMDGMRRVIPGLSRIEVEYTANRTLGLAFHEEAVGKPWTSPRCPMAQFKLSPYWLRFSTRVPRHWL